MQITFYSEDTPQGLTVDWPVVPRVGEVVTFSYPGGDSLLAVDRVMYFAGSDGALHSVRVELTYDGLSER